MISDELEKTLQRANEIASNFKHEYMTIEHLLYSLIEDEDASEVFKSCDINVNLLKNELENFLNDNLNELVNNYSE